MCYHRVMKLLIGTANKGKFIEMAELLKEGDVDCVFPADIGITEVPSETGDTFRDNARLKALFYRERSGLPVLADDSGIIVDALKDELGVFTRRWGAGPDVSDRAWVDFFLERMRGEPNKKARFLCTLCHIDEAGNESYFEGTDEGTITDELEAEFLPGLPLSACFKPVGKDRVYSALDIAQKNEISHRGRAVRAFVDSIRSGADQ